MSIVTKTGDDGTSGLYGGGRIAKDSARLHANGTVDELNALLGIVLTEKLRTTEREQLTQLQHVLFRLGGDLATPMHQKSKVDRMGPTHITLLEEWINELERTLPIQRRFILPGGTRIAAHLHHARTVCRRAERWVVAARAEGAVNADLLVFLNRLGDYLFLLARKTNADAGSGEVEVQY